jgi:hypothetical protein
VGDVRVKRKTVQVPHDGPGLVKRAAEVWARLGGRDDEPDLPAGWVQLGVDGDGRPLFGYIGPRNPSFRFDSIEDMRRRWGG